MCRRLADPAVEMLTEEVVPVLVLFKRLQIRGEKFDPCLCHLLRALERQIYDSSADGDSDYSDAFLDSDDSDEDYARAALPLWRQIQQERCGKSAIARCFRLFHSTVKL